MRTLVALLAAVTLQATRVADAQAVNPCRPRAGVPADTLLAMAMRLHPEASAPSSHNAFVVVGLVFDAECRLVDHAIGRRSGPNTVSAVLARLIPETAKNAYVTSGFVEIAMRNAADEERLRAARDSIIDIGTPWIVWGVQRPGTR